jgi:signal transduction histidine kinase/ActR/RegA family two-component response regulator
MIDAKTPASEKRSSAALAQTYLPIMRALSGVLALYYLLLAGAHLQLLEGATGWFMAAVAVSSGILIGSIRFLLVRESADLKTLESATTGVIILVATNITIHALVVRDPIQFVYLPVIVTAIALIGPTVRALVANLMLASTAGIFILIDTPANLLAPFLFTGITSLVAALLAGRWKIRAVMEQAKLTMRAEALAEESRLLAASAIQRAETEERANAAKGAFLAQMSHELRTPLNGIIGVAGALKAQPLDPRQQEMVDLIEKSGETLAVLVSDILDLAKIDAGKLELEASEFDLREELLPLLKLMEASAVAKGIDLLVEFDPTADGRFLGDATRLKQVVTNLCNNAIKFTSVGQVKVQVTYATAPACLKVSVEDTGIGFDAQTADRLFEPYTQADAATSRMHGGTGLGLSICHALCALMNGRIFAESEPGSGARFTMEIELPRTVSLDDYLAGRSTANRQKTDTDVAACFDDLQEQGLRVLLAEDHPANQAVVQMLLEPLGVDLVIVDDGAEALAEIGRQHFDLVLMDMQMPVMDGLAATRAIRGLERRLGKSPTPVIMLTANAMAHHRTAARQSGANLHLAKPVTPTSLFEAISTVLAEAESQQAEGAVTTG